MRFYLDRALNFGQSKQWFKNKFLKNSIYLNLRKNYFQKF